MKNIFKSIKNIHLKKNCIFQAKIQFSKFANQKYYSNIANNNLNNDSTVTIPGT
jgi:hypothetical protein